MSNSIRPNFFIVGAMKAGTTSLHRYLNTHPNIYMPATPKEPTYFLDRDQLLDVLPGVEKLGFWRSEQNYLDLFSDAGAVNLVGEASANYSRLNRVEGVPKRIARFSPDAKIVYIMRDPITRTISHYWYMVRFFAERRDMLPALRDDPDYVDTSYYAMQLRPYIELFGAENVFTLTMEELRDSPEKTISELLGKLGVDDSHIPENLGNRENQTPSALDQVRGSGVLHRFRYSKTWSLIENFVPKKLKAVARQFSQETVSPADVDVTEAENYLRPIQLPQTQELSEMLNRSFPEWTTLYARTSGHG